MVEFPQSHQDLLKDESKAFAVLATIMDDGTPQATPIWFNIRDGYLLINSAKGRKKDLNMRRNPQIALLILDPKDPYRYLQVRGRVVDMTTEGADAHIDELSYKYSGQGFTFRKGDVRVTYKILPEHINPH